MARKSTRTSRECRDETVSPEIWPVVVLVTECVIARTIHETLCCGRRSHRIFATSSFRPPRRTFRYAFGDLQSGGRKSPARSAPSRRGIMNNAG
jgi:hypothetical protein